MALVTAIVSIGYDRCVDWISDKLNEKFVFFITDIIEFFTTFATIFDFFLNFWNSNYYLQTASKAETCIIIFIFLNSLSFPFFYQFLIRILPPDSSKNSSFHNHNYFFFSRNQFQKIPVFFKHFPVFVSHFPDKNTHFYMYSIP